jgi:hypothetical protein
MILFLLACGAPPERPSVATAESTLAACATYDDKPDVYGVCVVEHVATLPTVADVAQVCGAAGTWEGECRHAWVAEMIRMQRPFPRSALLEACGTSADCAFQLLDTHAEGDVSSQLRLCESHVAAYLSDCVAHTLDRWVLERKPDNVEGQRVVDAEPAYADAVGQALGRAAACGGSLTCGDAVGPAWDACRRASAELRADPRRCQVRSPATLRQ